MSQIMLIAADKPLPLCSFQEMRTHTFRVGGKAVAVTLMAGLKVEEHYYYRAAVEKLGYPMKPHQYELALEYEEKDLWHLQDYLEQNLSPGEVVELWSVRLDGDESKPRWFQSTFSELNMFALGMLFQTGQTCLTVER